MVRYPWQSWLDGQAHVLRAGHEYQCSTQSMRRLAYAAGARHGLMVEVQNLAGSALQVRAWPKA